RIAFIAADADLSLLLTSDTLCDSVAELQGPVLNLRQAAREIAVRPDTRPESIDDDDLCYIIYTSGTSGRPKGVAVTQDNICQFLRACIPVYRVAAEDRVYQGMTLAFDFSIEEVWPTFAAGATLVAGPNDHRRFGSGLVDFLCEHQVSVMACVPT